MMPEALRHRLAWQQHFMEEDWVLESYATEDSMPKTPQHLAQLSARLSNSDRQAHLQHLHVNSGTVLLVVLHWWNSDASITVCSQVHHQLSADKSSLKLWLTWRNALYNCQCH